MDYPSRSGPMQYNLLAGILTIQRETIETETSLDIKIQSSILAPPPPSPSLDQTSKVITVAISSIQADEVRFFWFSLLNDIRSNIKCRIRIEKME